MGRRSLARSVVVTVSLAELLASGCGQDTAPKVAEVRKAERDIKTANPPRPEQKPEVKKGPVKYTPKLPGTGPVKPEVKDPNAPDEPDPFPVGKNKIQVGTDYIILEPEGSCTESRDPKCKPGKHCNPPPLRTIDCPKELQLPKFKKEADVYQNKDHKCWEKGKEASTRVVCPDKWQPPPKVPEENDDDDHSDDDDQKEPA